MEIRDLVVLWKHYCAQLSQVVPGIGDSSPNWAITSTQSRNKWSRPAYYYKMQATPAQPLCNPHNDAYRLRRTTWPFSPRFHAKSSSVAMSMDVSLHVKVTAQLRLARHTQAVQSRSPVFRGNRVPNKPQAPKPKFYPFQSAIKNQWLQLAHTSAIRGVPPQISMESW